MWMKSSAKSGSHPFLSNSARARRKRSWRRFNSVCSRSLPGRRPPTTLRWSLRGASAYERSHHNMRILVTGGAGFIGSAFVRLPLENTDFQIVTLHKLTYAGNLENLAPVADNPRYRFVRGDIADGGTVEKVVADSKPDAVVDLRAESDVDR